MYVRLEEAVPVNTIGPSSFSQMTFTVFVPVRYMVKMSSRRSPGSQSGKAMVVEGCEQYA